MNFEFGFASIKNAERGNYECRIMNFELDFTSIKDAE